MMLCIMASRLRSRTRSTTKPHLSDAAKQLAGSHPADFSAEDPSPSHTHTHFHGFMGIQWGDSSQFVQLAVLSSFCHRRLVPQPVWVIKVITTIWSPRPAKTHRVLPTLYLAVQPVTQANPTVDHTILLHLSFFFVVVAKAYTTSPNPYN